MKRVANSCFSRIIFGLIACYLVLSWQARAQKGAAPAKIAQEAKWDPAKLGETVLRDPVWVYNNWSSYDELSDSIPLTEELAMKELDEIVRLEKYGVHFDYYMMD